MTTQSTTNICTCREVGREPYLCRCWCHEDKPAGYLQMQLVGGVREMDW